MITSPKFSGKLIVIEGPTASGKTGIAIKLAKQFGAEIISADSRQFYKEIPIGTAAPTNNELNKVVHHFVGTLSVTDDYNVSKFEHDVLNLLNSKLTSCPIVIMTGGSGLYIDAVCKGIDNLPDIDAKIRRNTVKLFEKDGIVALQEKLMKLDPEYYQEVDLNNPKRLLRAIEVCLQTGIPYSQLRKNQPQKRNFDIIKIGINVPRDVLIERINNRVDVMMQLGWEKEAKAVYKYKNLNSLNTVGYKELFAFFENKITFVQASEKIKTNTRRYAKRQMTWFRKDKEINWFNYNDVNEMIKFIKGEL
jgi:tRNA dimethylallyltransferase